MKFKLQNLTFKTGWGLKQAMRITKISLVLILATCFQISARSYAQNVTLVAKETSLEKICMEIHRQTGYNFFYKDDCINNAKKVTINLQDAPLSDALDACLAGQPIVYKITGKTIVLTAKDNTQQPVKYLLKGKVTDKYGSPISGAAVVVKNTRKGTTTDDEGNYAIEITGKEILTFRVIGFAINEVSVSGKTIINVQMEEEALELAETTFISTGYQTISKERSAGSFNKPDMQVVTSRSASMNIVQRLDGQIPGLILNNSQSGVPISIRGLATIGVSDRSTLDLIGTSRNPLYVVDGIPIADVSIINPQDVADITVLKDATAASIWGARAANGVIVITTKKGDNSDDRLKIQYDAFVNIQGKPDLNYIPVLTSQQFIQTAREIMNSEYFLSNPWNQTSPLPPHELILFNKNSGVITEAQANKSLDSLASINNLQQIRDLWYRNASLMNHTLSISAGGKVYSVYGSLAYTNTTSSHPGDKNNTYKINVRQDFNINKWLQTYLITDLSNNLSSSKRNISIDNRFYPYQLFRDQQGNNISMPYMGNFSDAAMNDYAARSKVNLNYNPLDEFNYGNTNVDNLFNRIIAGVKIALPANVRFEGVYGYVKESNRATSFDSADSYGFRTDLASFTVAPTISSTPIYYLPTTGGNYSVNNNSQTNWTIRNQLVYDKNWKDGKHLLIMMVGQEAQKQFSVSNSSFIRGYNEALQSYTPIDYATLSTDGVANTVIPSSFGNQTLASNEFWDQSESETRFTSYYANIGYTFQRKYSINSSWRLDKSNLFGLDKSTQSRPVWSVGGKWIMSEEQFMKGITWMNRLALRATYGITGNSPDPGTAASQDILQNDISGFLLEPGLTITQPANPKLGWEGTTNINLGIDFSVLNGRINATIDVYRKHTEDLLGQMATNPFTGYHEIRGNFGNIENKGLEISLHTTNVKSGSFSWNSSLALGYNKNKITKLNSTSETTTGSSRVSSAYVTGYPAFALFAYKYAGLDSIGDPQVYLQDGSITKAPYVTTADDIVFMGTYQPVWSGGFTNSFHYKGLTLTASAIFNLGHVMRRDVGNSYSGRVISNSIETFSAYLHPDFLNRWKQPGDEAHTNVPRYIANSATSSSIRDISYYTFADINVVSASFIKMRDITLSYNLPSKLINRLHLEGISLRAQVSNIMLWKANNFEIDPEFYDLSSGTRVVPSSKSTFSLGIHLNF